MSRRALRRLQEAEAAAASAKAEAAEAKNAADNEEEEERVEPVAVATGPPSSGSHGNQFALLMAGGGGGSGSDNDDGVSDDDEKAGMEPAEAKAPPPSRPEKKSKSKKKKDNSNAKQQQNQQKKKGGLKDDDDEFLLQSLAAAAAKSLPSSAAEAPTGRRGGPSVSNKPLLSVDLRLLDGSQELRRLFGHAAGEPVRPPPASAASTGRSARGGAGYRRGLLVQPKPTWPPVVRLGLSMSADSGAASGFASDGFPAGSSVYRFEHSREYQRTQLAFADAVESGQPELLTEILRRQPYHVDSLLQLAEAFRIQEDAATAADLVERALYALECAMSPGFSLVTDRCRLSFARRENRALFAGLLRHALALTGRCCHRACLEACKLLLSLSPTADPMAALLLLDAACLMSGQEDYLLRLAQAWEPTRHLSQLPNWAYSVALARFRLGGQPDAADAALDEALLLFPSVLPPLLARLSVDAGLAVTQCRLFSEAAASAASSSPGLSQLCNLYVQRCGHCWKEAPAITFLVAGASRVVAMATATPPDRRVADYAERRRRRYRRTPPNVLRHLLVSDARDALAGLPADVDPAGLNAFDPLPPPDSVCDYDLAALRRLRGSGGSGRGRNDDDNDEASEDGLVAAFLRSLMPNYDPNAPPQQQAAGAQGGGGLAGLLDSVRQLLNGLGPPPPPPGAGQQGGGGEDEEPQQ